MWCTRSEEQQSALALIHMNYEYSRKMEKTSLLFFLIYYKYIFFTIINISWLLLLILSAPF